MKKLIILLLTFLLPSVCPLKAQPADADSVKTTQAFWQKIRRNYQMDNYFQRKSHCRQQEKLNEASHRYLEDIDQILYRDAYVTDYVQGLFAQVSPEETDELKAGYPAIDILQSPVPDAFILPSGSLLITTGLLCTLDSEEELKAIMASELAHYVLNHPVRNVLRAKRTNAWGVALLAVASIGAVALDVATENSYYYDDDNHTAETIAASVTAIAGVGAVASIAAAEALINPAQLGDLGMKYKRQQEYEADLVSTLYLMYNDIPANALSSALKKIKAYYEEEPDKGHPTRYNDEKALKKRIKQLHRQEDFPHSHYYRKAISDVLTFNAAMYQNDHQYQRAEQLVQKNIDERLASDYDYLILVKSRMARKNTPESNLECLELLEKARELSPSPNLDISKQEILLLLRMRKQAKAADALHEYLEMLDNYRQQNNVHDEEKEWIEAETGWAQKTLNKIKML